MSDDDIDWPEHAFLPGERPLMDGGVIDLGLDLRFHDDTERYTMPTDEKLTPERAIRLLHAINGQEEATVLALNEEGTRLATTVEITALAADIALIAQLLADHIERSERVIERLSILAEITQPPPEVPLATQQRLDPHANDHIIELRPGKWIIQHPLSERLNGSLLDCSVEWGREDVGLYGRFVMEWDDEADEWVLGDRL